MLDMLEAVEAELTMMQVMLVIQDLLFMVAGLVQEQVLALPEQPTLAVEVAVVVE